MNIFLSYASDDLSVAEQVCLALREEGHDVFFDRTGIPAGDVYNMLIREEIYKSDHVVFLISPTSVEPGRYTLTELRFAQERWKHPRGKVLPVMIKPTGVGKIPNYLKAVSILEPAGDIAAEVASALAHRRRGNRRLILAFALAVPALAAALAAAPGTGGAW